MNARQILAKFIATFFGAAVGLIIALVFFYLIPTHLLKAAYVSTIMVAILGIFSVCFGAWGWRYLSPWTGKSKWKLAGTLAGGVLLAITVPVLLFIAHVYLGTPASGSDLCDKGLQKVESCYGRDWSFMQGRRWLIHGAGTPDPLVCETFKKIAGRNENWGQATCDFSATDYWRKVDCSKYNARPAYFCFYCMEYRNTGDTNRYLIGFSEDCKQGLYIDSANNQLFRDPADYDEHPGVGG